VGRRLTRTQASRLFKPGDLKRWQGPLLLDTHIWLWYLEGDSARIGRNALSLLEKSGSQGNLVVSDISFWEIGVKAAKGRLSLSVEVNIWLSRASSAPGFRFLPLERDVLTLSTQLAGTAHNDPADRMLLAIAQLNNMPLVTADEMIINYAKANAGTPVVDARR
jgi:PIN domain nuclease of toxin-antitoxin system